MTGFPGAAVNQQGGRGPWAARKLEVSGRRITYWATDKRDQQLLFLHGTSAHSLWWHAVIPHLADEFQCIAIDNSGHGDSSHTPHYTPQNWIEEIRAVSTHENLDRPVVVGHSRGGRLAVLLATAYDAFARGLVLMDSGIRPPEDYRPPMPPLGRPQRIYDSFDDARRHFRLLPVQTPPPADVMDPVAAYSLHRTDTGWTWKYDVGTLFNLDDDEVGAALPKIRVPVAMAYGELSTVVTDKFAQYMTENLPLIASARLPAAEHHLILSHPDESADFIRHTAQAMYSGPAAAAAGDFPLKPALVHPVS